MGEHLDLDKSSRRSADLVSVDDGLDVLDLSEIELAGQHDDIGKLCIESESLCIGNAELCGNMHFHAYLTGIYDGCHV